VENFTIKNKIGLLHIPTQVISYSPLFEWNGTRAQISFYVAENSVHSSL